MKRLHWVLVTLLPLTSHVSRLTAQEGSWKTEGYGYYLEFRSDSLFFHEVTAVSCIPSYKAVKVDPPAGARAAYRMAQGNAIFLLIPTDGGRMRLHRNGAASDMIMAPTTRPAMCDRPTTDTPESNFDVFATTWAEQYGFFDLKKADWKAIVAANRPRITSASPAESLFAVISSMIEPLHDAHTFIGAGQVGRFGGLRRTTNMLERADAPKAYALTETFLSQPVHKFCNGQLEFSMLGQDIGYLRLRSFSGYHPEGYDAGLIALEAALDTIFTGADTWKGMVIDVRINGGGADPYGLAIASRLATQPYLAYTKEARLDPVDPSQWTPGQDSRVLPSTRPGFRGNVALLTGVLSISAAETFTQALMHRAPKVTRVGENTQGVFSDVLVRSLPNGWRFGLPNERFVTDGKTWDGPGIPPDVEVPVFAKADLDAGKDVALAKAIEIVSRKP
ncbi:MAG TPA: S41 family peptidase [Gemmatimonadales bacterium]|nr:S41 family peptidase [Gemmatimonadales bacterium]